MTDIVERLRMVARIEGEPALRDAADEIERLRAELAVYETAVKDRETALDDRDALIAEALAVTDRAKSDDAIRADVRRILSRAPEGAADRIRAEQREADAQIAESWVRVPVGAGTDGYVEYGSRERFVQGAQVAAAIRGGDPRGE